MEQIVNSFGGFLPIILLIICCIVYAIYRIVRDQRAKHSNLLVPAAGTPSHESNTDGLYEIVAEELRSNSLKQGLWVKAFAEADGDDSKARAAYIRHRVAQLEAERTPEGTSLAVVQPESGLKRTLKGIGVLITWLLVLMGVVVTLASAYYGDAQTPEARRTTASAGFYAVVGIGILSAVYARKRRALWFIIGCIGTFLALTTISTLFRFLR